MTDLVLLPRKAFELVLSDGSKVEGQFGTWALKRFGQKRNMGLEKLMEVFQTNVSLDDMVDFILCAIEYKDRMAGRQPFTDLQLCKWIDDYTIDTGKEAVLMTLFSHSSAEEQEKKSLEAV